MRNMWSKCSHVYEAVAQLHSNVGQAWMRATYTFSKPGESRCLQDDVASKLTLVSLADVFVTCMSFAGNI